MTVVRVSTAADGSQGDSLSSQPSLSADGTKVAFQSFSDNLVPGDTNNSSDVFVKDLVTGVITRISTAADGTEGNANSTNAVLSADGTKLAFQSFASNLVPGDTNGAGDLFVKDLVTGAITRASTAADGSQSDGFNSTRPSISADGTKVAFVSDADNLGPEPINGHADSFVKDLTTGAITQLGINADGTQSNRRTEEPSISADGTKVAFQSAADNIVPDDTNGRSDIFVQDLTTGVITRVSTDDTGAQATGGSYDLSLSADGTRVAFESDADNLVADDTNGVTDIFVKDLVTGAITRASTAADGTQGDFDSTDTALSADGTKVAFQSLSTNLAPGDTGFEVDLYVKDLTTGAVTRVNTTAASTRGIFGSFGPALSADGSKIAFESDATDLVPSDTNGVTDIFVADFAPCYATGTRLRTARGDVAVEALEVGDHVVTAVGEERPIRWIGHRRLDCTRHPRPEAVWPVRVLAGAFGESLPKRDLFLSPDHAVCVKVLDEVLIPVKHLINNATVAQVEVSEITYWHVELDSHDVLLAESLPAESFLDTGVRAGFENAGEHTMLHPDFAPLSLADFCLPLMQEGAIVDAVRARLLARAAALGWRFTAEDDLHALVDGVTIRPERDGVTARFAIPATAREVRLVSRSFVPERIDVTTRDGRRLGVPLRGLSAAGPDGLVRSLPIDHPLLSEGFSFVQEDGGDRWRWTDGDAPVPAALWAGATGEVVLTVETAPDRGTTRAWQAPDAETDPGAAPNSRSHRAA